MKKQNKGKHEASGQKGVIFIKHVYMIKALAQRYDGNPGIAFIDIGTVGQWGEWHSEKNQNVKVPIPENAKKIVDIYIKNHCYPTKFSSR